MILATTFIDWHTTFFLLFAGMAALFALMVVFANNVVRMAFYLILSLGATSGLFFLAGATFVGAMQLMIYVGGTLVLLIFGVMLTAQNAFVTMKTNAGDWLMSLVVGGCLFAMLGSAAFGVADWRTARADRHAVTGDEVETTTQLGLGFLGVRVDKLSQEDPTLVEGMSGYLLPFEIVSVHLLVVLIGAAYLARTKKRISRNEAAS